ncbi:MAG: LytR/AlgR family response regulator transcription factor [Planctomycetia bacterium]
MIVDADPGAVRRIKASLKGQPGIVVAGTAHTVAQALEQARTQRPDVVFLDVSIADDAGTMLARHLDREQAIVVVTDRPDYAIAAYQFGAVDYLLKPCSAARLQETMRRLDRLFARSATPAPADAPSVSAQLRPTDRIPLSARPSGQRTTDLVPVADVLWIESLQNYSIVQLPGHDRRQLKRTLTEWEAMLPAMEFARLGRSHLVQIAKVRAISSPTRNEWLVHFHDADKPLRLGRAAAGKLRAILRGSCPA